MQELILTRVNAPYTYTNVYFKVKFVGLSVPRVSDVSISIDGIQNPNQTVTLNSSQPLSNQVSNSKYFKDNTGQEYIVYIVNVNTNITTTLSVIHTLPNNSTLTSNSLEVTFISQPFLSPSFSPFISSNLPHNYRFTDKEMPQIVVSESNIHAAINASRELVIDTTNIRNLIEIRGSDGSIIPANYYINSNMSPHTAVISITTSTLGPVIYTITGNSELGIISSEPFTITNHKPLSIPPCPNLPGALITIRFNKFIDQVNSFWDPNNTDKSFVSGSDIIRMRDTIPFGLPRTDDGFAYAVMSLFLANIYKISNSRICNAKVTPNIIDITSTTDIIFTFIITDRILPEYNLVSPHTYEPLQFPNDYLSYNCIADWISSDFRNSDDIRETVQTASSSNGKFPSRLQSPSCSSVFNSPGIEPFTGILSNKEHIDVTVTQLSSASGHISSPSSPSLFRSPSSVSSVSNSDNSLIIIVVIIVVPLLLFGGIGLYMYYKQPKSRPFRTGQFELGE